MERNENLNFLLCDDDPAIRGILPAVIKSYMDSKGIPCSVFCAIDERECFDVLKNKNIDVVLMDIEMPGKDGIAITEHIKKKYPDLTVIFVSSREDRVFDSLTVHPFGFVRKGKFADDFSGVMKDYIQKRKKELDSKIVFKVGPDVYSFSSDEIIYIEGQNKNQRVRLYNGNELVIRSTMSELEDSLKKYGFMRIHKGYLLNLAFIKVIEVDKVLLTDGESLPIPVKNATNVKKEYLRYMEKEE